ncbi:hypothetical protein F4692_000775 [Nocardioides cavernae]|uniref:Uncharacterized protein n=1 Tax=Nocardioides cavernae TaxID=1921566 RepID=A0A7Y9H126_9ACTN|nr:hypothetical protein [Nocardioides cavernae]
MFEQFKHLIEQLFGVFDDSGATRGFEQVFDPATSRPLR